jgi:hypothetical protein
MDDPNNGVTSDIHRFVKCRYCLLVFLLVSCERGFILVTVFSVSIRLYFYLGFFAGCRHV